MMRVAALVLLAAGCLPAADLDKKLAALVEAGPMVTGGSLGVHVVNLTTGKSVYAFNESLLFLPASNMKLFTAALTLSRLGGEYRYETKLVREESGSVVLVGSGDPSMSMRGYPFGAAAQTPLRAIEELVEQAIAAGLRQVDGDVVGDDRRYPWSPYPESWTADDARRDFGAPVSALALDDNAVSIVVRPGVRAGELAHVELTPGFEYFTISNRVTTIAGTSDQVRVVRVPGSREIVLTGAVGAAGPGHTETVAVDDPALFSAHALYDALLRRGIPVRGRPVARHRVEGSYVESGGQLLAQRRSPPMSELLQTMMKVSQNLHAEMFLREVSTTRNGLGTVDDGLREMRAFLTEMKIPAMDWRSEDGSGLARNDEVTPTSITRLLGAMNAGEQRELWNSLLPVGGQDGTLSARLCCMAETAAIRAKTGTLTRAVALSGYAESPTNGRLAFSILVNNFSAPTAEVRGWVDRLALALVE